MRLFTAALCLSGLALGAQVSAPTPLLAPQRCQGALQAACGRAAHPACCAARRHWRTAAPLRARARTLPPNCRPRAQAAPGADSIYVHNGGNVAVRALHNGAFDITVRLCDAAAGDVTTCRWPPCRRARCHPWNTSLELRLS